MHSKSNLLLLLCFFSFFGMDLCAQKFHLPPGQNSCKVRFELINNLIVVPVELNGATLKFVLDSGVSTPILFNLSDQDSLEMNDVSEISLKGLGDGEPIKALQSKNNKFQIGDALNLNQKLFVVLDRGLNFSTSLGTVVHGMMGFDIFNSFVVEVNYARKALRLSRPDGFVHKYTNKREVLPLKVINKKAYIQGFIDAELQTNIPVNLLLDTGSSDALWLFRNSQLAFEVPENRYEDFLGKGLSGDIYGERTRLKGFRLGRFSLIHAKTAFPFKESFALMGNLGNRNGSLGGEMLKRFNLVIDYQNEILALQKNGLFKSPFHYNHSGIELQHNGVRYIAGRLTHGNGIVRSSDSGDNFGSVQLLMDNRTRVSLVPEIVVSAIRAGSTAEAAGLKEGDVILAVNGKKVYDYKLQEILQLINANKGRHVKLTVERYNRGMVCSFEVKDIFEGKKKPSQ